MQILNIKEWKLFELQITQTRNPLSISGGKCKFNTPKKKWEKYLLNEYKIVIAHLQYANNYNAKLEYKRLKTTDYTNKTSPYHFRWEK